MNGDSDQSFAYEMSGSQCRSVREQDNGTDLV